MVTREVAPKERQAFLIELIRERGIKGVTVVEAWQYGATLGFYQGGDGPLAKGDLQDLCRRRQARKHDGFWRHINEPDHIRLKCLRWADYWTVL